MKATISIICNSNRDLNLYLFIQFRPGVIAFSAVPGLPLNSPSRNSVMEPSEAEGKQTASRHSPGFVDV